VRALRSAVVLAAVVLAAALTLVPAPAAVAAPGMELAVQDDFVFVTQSYYKRASALKRIGQLRSRWVRVNVLWSSVNGTQAHSKSKPHHVLYDWTAYDSLVNAARERGVHLQLALTGSAPAWATGNKKVGPYQPSPKYFQQFVRAAVQHFGAFVDRYSVWNEPNLKGWLAPLDGAPKIYRSLYSAAYSEIRKGDPSAQVLIGETSPYATPKRSTGPVTFLNKVLKYGPLVADGYAHHPYDLGHKPGFKYPGAGNATLATLGNLTAELDRQAATGRLRTPAGRPLDLWLTEYGYLRSGRYGVSEAKRASYLRKAYDMALANPRVRQILQYLLVEPAPGYTFFDTSLLNKKGKPFGKSFQTLADWANAHQGEINGNVPSSGGGGNGGGGGGGNGGGNGNGGGGGFCAPLVPLCLPKMR
jgi:hypothetical protein